jgi:hypothetical protein
VYYSFMGLSTVKVGAYVLFNNIPRPRDAARFMRLVAARRYDP